MGSLEATATKPGVGAVSAYGIATASVVWCVCAVVMTFETQLCGYCLCSLAAARP